MDPSQLTLREIMERMRDRGSMPLGTLIYNFKTDQLEISVFREVDPEEVNALLARLGVRINFNG